jgi:S-layer protein (TIGR01567 family)
MRKYLIVFALIGTILSMYLMGGANCLEIRGPVIPVKNTSYEFNPSSSGIGSSSGMPIGFYGFFYDIDDDLGTESLTMNINGQTIDGSINPPGLIYSTSNQSKRLRFRDWGRYNTIGFLGLNYFVCYNNNKSSSNGQEPFLYKTSEHKNVLEDNILLKVLEDSDSTYLFSNENPLKLKDGYELALGSVDLKGQSANIKLFKNGDLKKESVVICEPNAAMDQRTFVYRKTIRDVKELVTLGVHFDKLFTGLISGREIYIAQVDGIFQLLENPAPVQEGSVYGVMSVVNVNANNIVMTNRDKTIFLTKGKDLQLMGNIRLRTADKSFNESNPLLFYIYSNITDTGTYEIHGPIDEIVQGRGYEWDFKQFPGFMYDLDSNIGTESIEMGLSGSYDKGDAKLQSLVYETKANMTKFKRQDWGSYYTLGYMGEKYFAGYMKNDSKLSLAKLADDKSGKTNLLANDVISKVLTDNNQELRPIASGSILPLKEGYELRITEITDKIKLELAKDGITQESDKIITPGNGSDATYLYQVPLDGSKQNNFVTLAVHFKNSYVDPREIASTTIDGIWQISDNFTTISSGTALGIMKIQEVNSNDGKMSIKMVSDERTLSVTNGKTKKIMEDYFIRFADQEDSKPLRFYILKNSTIGIKNIPSPPPPPIENVTNNDTKPAPDLLLCQTLAALLCAILLARRFESR